MAAKVEIVHVHPDTRCVALTTRRVFECPTCIQNKPARARYCTVRKSVEIRHAARIESMVLTSTICLSLVFVSPNVV